MLNVKTRLNSNIRDAIVAKALVTSGLVAAQEKVIEDRSAFAEKILAMALEKAGVTQEDLRKQYQAAVKLAQAKSGGFIQVNVNIDSSGYFTAGINGQVRSFYLNGGKGYGEKTHIFVKKPEDGGPFIPKDRPLFQDNALMDELSELDMRDKELAERRKELQDVVRASVSKAGTVGSLLKAWPEAAELLPDDYIPVDSGTGLALNPDTLNALCGIPSEK